jgi:peptidyl-prolyl cis-trans isomerase D
MAALDNKKTGMRILLGIVVVLLGGSMLLYLVPQGTTTGEAASTDTVAKVGDQSVTIADIRQQMAEVQQRNPIPRQLESIYAQQILNQLVFQKEIEYEAKRLGITVSDQERADRIKQFLPTAFNGGAFVGMDRYAQEVQQRFQLTVPVFEELIRQGLLEEKIRRFVTDGISASPADLQDAFRNRNEKVKLEYALIQPDELEAKITPDEAELKAAYEKNRTKYQVPEKRVVRYGLVDINQLRQNTQISDEQLKAQYQANIQQYAVPNRVHVEHILFTTVGKPDAEAEEVKKKAEDVLAQLKKGAKFEDLAKKYSEDPGTRDKGGDLGWIVQGQTVPEFEKTAFSLPKGQLSDLVKTQYGFHILRVLDKETAHTKPLEEVKQDLLPSMRLNEADRHASDEATKISLAIRQSSKTSLDELAKQFNLTLGETRPVTVTDQVIELGNSQELKDQIFRLKAGDLSLPIKTDRGYVIVSVKDIQPSHQGTLAEVRDRVVQDLKGVKAVDLAKSKTDDLVKRVRAGEKFEAVAKSLGLEAKTSDLLARNGSIPGAASGKQVSPAFAMKQGEVGSPVSLGRNWFVYQVAEKQEPNADEFEKQKKELTDSVLQEKRGMAFEAFRTSLDNRLKQEGKLKLMPEKMKSFGSLT